MAGFVLAANQRRTKKIYNFDIRERIGYVCLYIFTLQKRCYLEHSNSNKDAGLEYGSREDAVVVAVVGLAVQVQPVAIADLLELNLRDALVKRAQSRQGLFQTNRISFFATLFITGHFQYECLGVLNGTNIQLCGISNKKEKGEI